MEDNFNKNLDSYFTTGEFAKLCKVKKQTLFHYDDIGIFSPEIKSENGYRYYAYNQLEVFGVISILKEMDMPLKAIKKYLDNRSPKDLIDLLNKQVDEIDKHENHTNFIKASGNYAVIYHKGGYDTAANSYAKLVENINASGFAMGDYFYEEGMTIMFLKFQ